MDRRDFMTTVGASALAMNAATMAFGRCRPRRRRRTGRACGPSSSAPRPTSTGWAGPGRPTTSRPGRPTTRRPWPTPPRKLGVDLQVDAEPVADLAGIDALVAQCKQSRPDGVILDRGRACTQLLAARRALPRQAGRHPHDRLQPHGHVVHRPPAADPQGDQVLRGRHAGLRLAGHRHAHAVDDLADGPNTRLCIINGEKTFDEKLAGIGTTLHHMPLDRWTDELAKLEETAEVKALAAEFTQTAKKIVEPKPEDVINSAKNYFVAKRIMAAENCQGISLNCLGLIGARKIPCPPCMAWLKLNDELTPGICECDWNAGIGQRLCQLLLGRPGFQQDPAPNTVNDTLMGAHCSSAHQAPRSGPARRAA